MEHSDGRLDEVEVRLGRVEVRLDEHTSILNEHTSILNEHSSTLNRHTEAFERIEARQGRQDDMMSYMMKTFDAIFARFDRSEREILAHIDMRYESLRSDMRAFKEELADHGRRIPALEQTTEQQGKQQKALSKRVSALEKRVS